jgi:catalase
VDDSDLVRQPFDADVGRCGHLLGGKREPVLGRAFDYWGSIDTETGRRIEDKVCSGKAPKPAEGMGER